MPSFRERLRYHVGSFFTNWRTSDAPIVTKVGFTLRNRTLAIWRGGCCGHHGQPGC